MRIPPKAYGEAFCLSVDEPDLKLYADPDEVDVNALVVHPPYRFLGPQFERF